MMVDIFMSFVMGRFINMVEGMVIGMVGRKYQTNVSVVPCVLVMMENTGLGLDVMGVRLRHLMMGEILEFRICCSSIHRKWDRNNWFLGMDLAVVGFIGITILVNLLSVKTETGVFRNV